MQDGCILAADFACRQSAAMLWRLSEIQFAKMGHPAGWLTLFRSSEPQEHLQALMVSGDLPVQCVYPTVESIHLHGVHEAKISALRIVPGDEEETILAKNNQIEQYIYKNRQYIYKPDAISLNCVVHPGVGCRVRWPKRGCAVYVSVSILPPPRAPPTPVASS